MTGRQEKMFEQFLPTAMQIASFLHDRYGGLNGCDIDDYRQIALMELMEAIKKWKGRPGDDFVRYARSRIKWRVLDEIRKLDEVGRSQRSKGRKSPSSLDGESHSDKCQKLTCLKDSIAARCRPDMLAAYDELRHMLSSISRIERAVVYLTYIVELTEWQAGAVLGYGESTISQIRKRAMTSLRSGKHKVSKATETSRA